MRNDPRGIALDRSSGFMVSLITKSNISSYEIWDILGIPLYYLLPPHAFPGFSRNPKDRLSPSMVALIVDMAKAFAKCHGSNSFKRRNIAQCITHLRIRGNPIPPQLTKALTLVSLKAEIAKNKWIGDKWPGDGWLLWCLRLIEQAEGTEVAEKVDKAIFRHRQTLIRKYKNAMRSLPRLSWRTRQRIAIEKYIELQRKQRYRISPEVLEKHRKRQAIKSRQMWMKRQRRERKRLKRSKMRLAIEESALEVGLSREE